MGDAALPLQGHTIIVTRARSQAGRLTHRLESLGAAVIEFPTIEIVPASDYGPLDAAIARLDSYDWLIFTSVNGVSFFRQRLRHLRLDHVSPRGRVCAIGPATRKAVEELGWQVDVMPDEYVAESVVAAFSGQNLRRKRILLPRAAVARDVVPLELRKRGAEIDVLEAYRTVTPADAPARVDDVFFGATRPDWITFTSSSTVNNFLKVITSGPHTPTEVLAGVRVASIGPVTTATAKQNGLTVDVEAPSFTIEGLADAIARAEG